MDVQMAEPRVVVKALSMADLMDLQKVCPRDDQMDELRA